MSNFFRELKPEEPLRDIALSVKYRRKDTLGLSELSAILGLSQEGLISIISEDASAIKRHLAAISNSLSSAYSFSIEDVENIDLDVDVDPTDDIDNIFL